VWDTDQLENTGTKGNEIEGGWFKAERQLNGEEEFANVLRVYSIVSCIALR